MPPDLPDVPWIILDGERLDSLFERMRQSFERSPVEVVIFIVLTAAIVALLIEAGRRQRRSARAQRIAGANERFRRVVERTGMSGGDLATLERMVATLEDPECQRDRVVLQGAAFDRAVRRLRATGPVPPAHVAALRRQLELPERAVATIHSTADLPAGQILTCVTRTVAPFAARVVAVDESGISAKAGRDFKMPAAGSAVRVGIGLPSGLYRFASRIRRVDLTSRTIVVDHCDRIDRQQNRAWFRRSLTLPARIERIRDDGDRQSVDDTDDRQRATLDRPTLKTRLADLGGNGASCTNPTPALHAGDRLVLHLDDEDTRVSLPATVVRTSRGDRLLHVQFTDVRSADRDRLMRLVL